MSTDAPEDEHVAVPLIAGRHPAQVRVPYVLQVSPIDAESSVHDEFYYDPFADLEFSDFAAARAFFVHHGHVVVFHDCPDAPAFQELFPQAAIKYITSLPDALIAEGHRILAHQRTLLGLSSRPAVFTPPRSIVDRYVEAGFMSSRVGAPSRGRAPSPSPTTVSSSSGSSAGPRSSSSSGVLRSASVSQPGGLRSPADSSEGAHPSTVVGPPPFARGLARGLRPDPEGDEFIFPHQYHGGSRSGYGGPHCRYGGQGYPPSRSRSTGYGVYPFHRHGGLHGMVVPPVVYPQGFLPPRDPGSHASASIASSLGSVAPLGSLTHPGGSLPSTSEITMAFSEFPSSDMVVSPAQYGWPPPFPPAEAVVTPAQHGGPPPVNYGDPGVPAFGVPPTATPGFNPATVPFATVPAAPAPVLLPTAAAPSLALPVPGAAAPGPGPPPAPAPGPGSGPPPGPAPAPPTVLPPAPAVPVPVRAELLKLDPIKDAKGFLDSLETIQFYLRMPEFSTGHADDSLTTDAANLEASRAWEGVLRSAVKDGTLKFLFENKGTLYHGRGFEMLAALMQHCRPDSVSNAFSSLLSLFNDVQGESESIIEYRSRFDGLTLELSRCKVTIPSFLMVMLFLRALHSRYSVIFEQYRSRFKAIETATLDSLVSDVVFHDGFTEVSHTKKKLPPAPGARHPTAATATSGGTDQSGRKWQTPFEWLAVWNVKAIKGRWTRAMAGTGICPICHRDEKPYHVPTLCPLLAEMNLKLVPLPAAPPPAPPPPTAAPTTPNVRAAAADGTSAGCSGSGTAPSGLTAALSEGQDIAGDYDSGDDFHWDGDEFGAEYTPKVDNVALYPPSCSHVSVDASSSSLPATRLSPRVSPALLKLLSSLSDSPIAPPLPGGRFAVADTGATDHMIPDKMCFISYKSIMGLSVRMGNNSFVPVLGRGTAIFSLNGKRILIRNVLHVPGLAVPLYSLRKHVTQRGCGFIGTEESGFLVYFPKFVLSVDTAVDSHLSFAPLGRTAPLDTLHYVQPRCPPVVYPSELGPTVSHATPGPLPALVEDDASTTVAVSIAPCSPLPTQSPIVAATPPLPSAPPLDLSAITLQLQSLSDAITTLSTPSPLATPLPAAVADDHDDSPTRLLSTMTPEEIQSLLHHDGTTFPPVRPCDTANTSDKKTHWTSEELHRIMGCRKFKNYKHLLQVSRDGEWVDGGEFPPSLGSYATIPKSHRGGALDKHRYKYLDAVHMDIAFGDCLSVGGFRYVLVLVDRATRYNWAFGLQSLSSTDIISAIRKFRAAAGRLATCFYCDCDHKLFGSAVSEYLIDGASKVVAAPAKRQSANGLVESHWKTMVHMARAYITEKQMPRSFWFYAIVHAARMMNAIPGRHSGRLASPFLLVHGVGHDERTWIPIFSLAFFHHERDGDESRSHHQAHTMDGIVVGRSPTSNALLVYNPRNKKYYEPDSYRIDSYRLPSSAYPSIKYDGGLFVSLLRDDNPQYEEKYPPGTRVERMDPITNMLVSGTVMDIPFPLEVSPDSDADVTDLPYTVLFDNGTTASIPLSKMAGLIPPPPIVPTTPEGTTTLLPPFLQLNSRITYEHDGQYHKGYLGIKDGVYRFSYKSHVNKRKEDWGVPLPHLPSTWVDLCVEGLLVPGHVSHTFLRSTSSPSNTTFDPVASFVSAINLHRDCPPSLLKALADTHPDREVWLASFEEEKRGITSLDTYTKISLGEYRALREKGAPRAIPTMCVLTIKKDEQLRPLRAKSRIVVLGNHEDRVWTKSEKFAPVLRQDSLRFLTSMAVASRRPLRQGDCKNAFCQGILPVDEITIVRPPSGDPEAAKDEYWLLKRTLYGLRRSPRHWYDKINAILQSIGLVPSLEDPCLYTGFITDPSNPLSGPTATPLSLGLYVDDFVYFSEDPAVEKLFCRLLAERCKVDFMGIVEWFLGVHFSWRLTPSAVAVHLNQSGFATNLVESFARDARNETPSATPYRSGVPIDSIAPSTDADDSPAQLRRKEAYQSLVGSIGWLSSTTRPDLAAAHSFLSSYTNKPASGHMKAALYVLHYIHSTHDYGISFTSEDTAPMHSYVHYPPPTDVEAYDDATPPKLGSSNTISAYSDACWGSQLGSSVADGTLLPLFKFRSMNGGIVFKNGGPLGWLGDRQERTSLSSCEAEIRATNATSKKVVDFRNLSRSVSESGFAIPGSDAPTVLYNDNEACVKWSYNMTSKAARHIELRDNSVREWVQDKTLQIKHVAGKINPADIFTKEMRDGAHFRRLRDSFMSRLSTFLSDSILAVHHSTTPPGPNTVAPAAARVHVSDGSSGYFSVLNSSSFFRTLENISHLCSAGRHLIRRAHRLVPAHLF